MIIPAKSEDFQRYRNACSIEDVPLRNYLPAEVRETDTLSVFKINLDTI